MSLTHRNPAVRTLAQPQDYRSGQFKDKNLLLFELFRANIERTGDMNIRGAKFYNCQIEGPAALLPLNGNTFTDCNFGISHGDMRTLILYPASPERVTGAIPMIDCVFDAVDFFSIGFTGHKQFLDSLLDVEIESAP